MVAGGNQLSRLAIPVMLLGFVMAGCASQPFGYSTDSRPVDEDGQSGSTAQRPETTGSVSAASSALLQQSRSQQRAGDTNLAAATIERAIRIDPRNPWLWLELGQLQLSNGDYSQAESLGRKAMSLAIRDDSVGAASQRLIVNALYGQGRVHEARQLESQLSR